MKLTFKVPSGRTIEVLVKQGSSAGTNHLNLFMFCSCPAENVVAEEPALVVAHLGNHSARDFNVSNSYWREWWNMPEPRAGQNVDVPANVHTFGTKATVVAGKTWCSGSGHPENRKAKVGDFYHDNDSGKVYKHVRSFIEKMAEERALDFDKHVQTVAHLKSLALPVHEMPPPPETRKHVPPAVVESWRKEIRAEERERLRPEVLEHAKAEVRKDVRQEVIDLLAFDQDRYAARIDELEAQIAKLSETKVIISPVEEPKKTG